MLQVPSWITERKLRLKSDTMFHTCNYTRYAGMQLVSAFKSGMIYLNLKCPISMLWHSTYLHLQIGQIRLTIYTLIRSLCQHRTKVSQSRLEAHFSQAPANASTTSSLCKLNFFWEKVRITPNPAQFSLCRWFSLYPHGLTGANSSSFLSPSRTISPEQVVGSQRQRARWREMWPTRRAGAHPRQQEALNQVQRHRPCPISP